MEANIPGSMSFFPFRATGHKAHTPWKTLDFSLTALRDSSILAPRGAPEIPQF